MDEAQAALAAFDGEHTEAVMEAIAPSSSLDDQINAEEERLRASLLGKTIRDSLGRTWVVTSITWKGDHFTVGGGECWDDADLVEAMDTQEATA